jgi:phosphoesterase RecJ-like protein
MKSTLMKSTPKKSTPMMREKRMLLNEALALSTVERINQRMSQAESCLLACHIRPDGDAIGSLLGLGLALKAAGKQVQMASEDGVPAAFRKLEGADQVVRTPQGVFDLVIVVDCSELERTGSALPQGRRPDINIDHHPTNTLFADINIVVPSAVATTEIIAQLAPAWGLAITPGVAAALLAGLVTDTIGFRTENVTAPVLRLAAELMDAGADLADIYRRSLVDRSFEALRLWGAGLSRVERSGRMVWASLTLDDRRAARYSGRDDADLINVLSSVDGADIAMIFIEQSNGRVKVSWRAQPGYDVSQLALSLGGGGHAAASGAEIPGALPEIQNAIIAMTRPLLNGGQSVQS